MSGSVWDPDGVQASEEIKKGVLVRDPGEIQTRGEIQIRGEIQTRGEIQIRGATGDGAER